MASDGYINNHTRLWGWRPDVMTELQTLCSDLTADSGLSPREVAVMVTAMAAARGDSYCSLAWGQKLADLSDEATAANVITAHLTGNWRSGLPSLSATPSPSAACPRQSHSHPVLVPVLDHSTHHMMGLTGRRSRVYYPMHIHRIVDV